MAMIIAWAMPAPSGSPTVAPYTRGSPSSGPATSTPTVRQSFTTTGDCVVDSTCITSSGYPANYGDNENCVIMPVLSGELVVEAFQTESGYDKLTVAGTEYESSNGPAGVVVDTATIIRWISDGSEVKKGFRICLGPVSTTSPTTAAVFECVGVQCSAAVFAEVGTGDCTADGGTLRAWINADHAYGTAASECRGHCVSSAACIGYSVWKNGGDGHCELYGPGFTGAWLPGNSSVWNLNQPGAGGMSITGASGYAHYTSDVPLLKRLTCYRKVNMSQWQMHSNKGSARPYTLEGGLPQNNNAAGPDMPSGIGVGDAAPGVTWTARGAHARAACSTQEQLGAALSACHAFHDCSGVTVDSREECSFLKCASTDCLVDSPGHTTYTDTTKCGPAPCGGVQCIAKHGLWRAASTPVCPTESPCVGAQLSFTGAMQISDQPDATSAIHVASGISASPSPAEVTVPFAARY
eukprot:gene57214-biopygen61773